MKAIRALKIVLKDTIMSREKAYLEECIKELEELNNRSCENCKYWGYKDDTTTIETCNFGLIDHYYNANSFCCNRYEKKDS